MSNVRPSKNIVRGEVAEIKGKFLDQLRTIHTVAEESPAAKWTKEEVERRFARGFAEGKAAGFAEGHAEGEKAGFEAGLLRGSEEARQEVDAAHAELIAAFAQDLAALAAQHRTDVENWYIEAEQRLASLAIEIARRAVSHELEMKYDAVVDIAKAVLGEVTAGTHVRLRVNPIQTATLESRREEILAALAHIRDLEIIADPSVHAGVIAEGDGGVIDARIESYLDRLTEQIEGEAA